MLSVWLVIAQAIRVTNRRLKMSGIFKNFLTTIPGLITLAGVAYQTWQTKTLDWPTLQSALVGVGLVFAKDFNVTGK